MRLKELIGELQCVKTWEKPRVELEQYPTPPDIAAHMLLAAQAEGDIDGCLVADLGCGGGVLGIGAALLGADNVLGIDIDPAALEVAAQNVAEAEVPVDLLLCDVLRFAVRHELPTAAAAARTPPPPNRCTDSALPTEAEFERCLQLDDGERVQTEDTAATASASGGSAPSAEPDATAGGDEEAAVAAVGSGVFDCVITNPPFGTQKHANGADMAFLRAGLALCSARGAVYSLHKTSTRAFIARTAAGWGASARVVAELSFAIPRMYKHHTHDSLDVAVDFWRLAPGPDGEGEPPTRHGPAGAAAGAQPPSCGGGRGRGGGRRSAGACSSGGGRGGKGKGSGGGRGRKGHR